jgi:hypothetical protein
MFQDFEDGKKPDEEGRGRMGVSLAVSAVVYILAGLGVVAAVATAKVYVDKRERDIAVEFAAAPTPVEKEKPKPKPKPKPKKEEAKQEVETTPGQQRGLSAPTEIPDEELQEASGGRLSDVEEINIDEMIGGGGSDGKKKTGPRQKRETVSRPKYLGGCRAPDVPPTVRTSAETIRIRVRILVMPDGVPVKAELENTHPLIPEDLILKCALAQRFEPARLPDGTAVPYPYRRQFTFKPSNI